MSCWRSTSRCRGAVDVEIESVPDVIAKHEESGFRAVI